MAFAVKRPRKAKSSRVRVGTPSPLAPCETGRGKSPEGAWTSWEAPVVALSEALSHCASSAAAEGGGLSSESHSPCCSRRSSRETSV